MKLIAVIPRLTLAAVIGVIAASYIPANESFAQADYSLVNVRDTVHIVSCGSCHLPYSPALLPLQSWQGIMDNLDDHFGEVVQLSEENKAHILGYMEKYALTEGQPGVMGQLGAELPDNPPLRITELPVFVNLHSNAEELLGLEREDRTLSTCEGCHRAAASHIFDKALLSVGTGDGPLSDYK